MELSCATRIDTSSRRRRRIICTPIPHTKKSAKWRASNPCARTDYNEQLERNKFILNGDNFYCWDDGAKNEAEKGDIFCFWVYDGVGKGGPGNPWGGGKFVFHEIDSVKDPSCRLPSWHNNVGQGNRNVLELSPPKLTLTYADMIKYGTRPSYHGTNYPTTGYEQGSKMMLLLEQVLSTK